MEFISNSLEETKKIAFDLVQKMKPNQDKATIVGLSGDLGSGKTTFMKYFAEALGVEETVQSPTFVIMKIFEINNSDFNHLIHIDAYRLENGEELIKLGWEKVISDSKNLICIEWPERVEAVCSPDFMLRFEHAQGLQGGKNQRKISFT